MKKVYRLDNDTMFFTSREGALIALDTLDNFCAQSSVEFLYYVKRLADEIGAYNVSVGGIEVKDRYGDTAYVGDPYDNTCLIEDGDIYFKDYFKCWFYEPQYKYEEEEDGYLISPDNFCTTPEELEVEYNRYVNN